jgi:hypothetical protein
LTVDATTTRAADHPVLSQVYGLLLGLERRANYDSTSVCALIVCRDAQSRFLRSTCLRVPAFAGLLKSGNATGFYAAAGDFLAALLPVEAACWDASVSRARCSSTAGELRRMLFLSEVHEVRLVRQRPGFAT